ncbi:MAG: Gfo/Idh/MocA family oxidoreductase [Bacteroidota bacterium]
MNKNRRAFLSETAKVASATALGLSFPSILSAGSSPNDDINIGLIGCKNRGFRVLQQHLDLGGIKCIALCDVDENVLREKSASLEKNYKQKPKTYKDYRKMLENQDLDAVIIGTPDHWHCLQMVAACEAGLDVYVEKPMANSIAECDIMVAAAKKYNRIVQVGQQQRSGKVWNEVMAYMKSGKLGAIRKTNIWANFNYGLGPKRQANTAVPKGVDYDMFLGPAPARSFNPARFHGDWRHFWDYGGGLMTDFGAHLIDMALWVKDITAPPTTVLAYGNRVNDPSLAKETYDQMSVVFPMEDYLIQWESNAGKQVGPYGRLYGLAFLGEKGTLVVDRSGYEILPEWDNEVKAHKVEAYKSEKFSQGHDSHMRDFVNSMRTRTQPVCPPEIGRNVALYSHMANIAVRSGAYKLEWDAQKRKFSNSKEANSFITPEYRKPWTLPKV